MEVTEVVIAAVVVIVGHVTALTALWLRLRMQLRTEQLRHQTLLMLTSRRPALGRNLDQLEGIMHLGLRYSPARYPRSGHE